MGYQALVFCPEEKTARTVAQVLTELEFAVETCTEPFAAVKKLMGQHFDAIVVDCDNEQNATLLFKSARNSSTNQASLAVAVVEGQAGVAKAFRIGANLVLTKPINIEQAKGTVRVARGLLRKSEPAKSAVPAPVSSAATPAKPAPPKAVAVAKPATPVAPKPVVKPAAEEISSPKPGAPSAWPAGPSFSTPPVSTPAVFAPAASSIPVAKDIAPLEINLEEPAEPVSSPAIPSTISAAGKLPAPLAPVKSALPTVTAVTSGGAASAPALAKILEAAEKAQASAAPEVVEKAADTFQSEPGEVVGSTPSFGYGATDQPEASGGSKKIVLGVVAAVVIAAAAYFGWTQFQGHSNQPASTQSQATASPVAKPQPVNAAAAQPAPVQTPVHTTPAATPMQDITLSTVPPKDSAKNFVPSLKENPAHPSVNSAKNSAETTVAKTEGESTPLVVKGGKGPGAQAKATAAEAPALSVIGLAGAGAAAPPPNLVPSTSKAFQPTLQTINISQGVSQGLLVKKISPSYPSNALRMHIEGSVQLLATVSKQGNITQVKVLSGDAQLTRAATDAVKQWKYKPYLLNGEPVDIQTQVTINFRLPK